MMDLWKSIAGMYEVELTSATPEDSLWGLNQRGIAVYQVIGLSPICVRFRIKRSDLNAVTSYCEKRGDTLLLRKRLGLFWAWAAFVQRPVLAAGVAVLLLATVLLPTRVLFVRVEGNRTVPDSRILEVAQLCGIRFGAVRKNIRSEQMKNALLERIPELEWAGVNTVGCVAVLSVREAPIQPVPKQEFSISSMVAICDGIVLECTAEKGNLLCSPGQLVKRGQVLISGYTDCGLSVRATNAQGEVFAQTVRDIDAVIPSQMLHRGDITATKRKISLILGKKRINLWKDSGISEGSCGRMYQEYVLTLPGGFQLPAVLCVESFFYSELSEHMLPDEAVSETLRQYAKSSVLQKMIAGQILTDSYEILPGEGVLFLEGKFLCREMIGTILPEQIGE